MHGSLTLVDRVQIGLVVPVSIGGGDGFQGVPSAGIAPVESGTQAGLGDLRVSGKVRIFGEEGEPLFFGAAAYVAAPLGEATAERRFFGDDSVRVGGYAIAEFVHSGFRVAANVGGFWRDRASFLSTEGRGQLTYSVAAGYEILPELLAFAELEGSSSFGPDVDENPLEARAAAHYRFGDFVATAGIGAGIVSGVGVPVVRAIAGFRWAPNRADADGDGILDVDDACVRDAEDFDGYEDQDGCPEPDNDEDGRADDADQCPDQAEDLDGFEDADGCPDDDNDGDGIRDGFDSCPLVPEDMDGDTDEDGCPDNDSDRDGIPDDVDQCVDAPEDTDGFGDEDGCPEDDFDQDGIPDDMDECPAQAEDDPRQQDGCPGS